MTTDTPARKRLAEGADEVGDLRVDLDREWFAQTVERRGRESVGLTVDERVAVEAAKWVQSAETERDAAVDRAVVAEARVADYERGITWDTTCANCANLLDRMYGETVAREKAERERDELRAAVEALAYASDDGTEYEHDHGVGDGHDECPACWAADLRNLIASAQAEPEVDRG